MFSLPRATELCARALANGGFTFRVADAVYPAEGYAVAIPGHERLYKQLTPGIIQDYMAEHAESFTHAGHCLGAWFNPESGTWYLDVSIVFPYYSQALAEGRRNQQIAVYDLGLGASIEVPWEGV